MTAALTVLARIYAVGGAIVLGIAIAAAVGPAIAKQRNRRQR